MISPSREMPSPYRISNSALAERRRDLVLDDLHARLVADHFFALLDRADAADVEPHGRVELQRVAAGRRLGVAEHHADLHADLVDEDDEGVRALDVAGELAQRLRHEPRLQAHVRVAHLAFDLGLRRERRDRVDDDDVDGARAHQHVGDLERLLARVGLRDQQIVDVHAELLARRPDRARARRRRRPRCRRASAISATTCSVSVVLPDDSGP